MLKVLFTAIIVGAFAVVAWHSDGSRIALAEVHDGDLHNCADYSTQAEAQAHLEENPDDPDGLDADDDGIACEQELDCPCDPPDANDVDDENCDDFTTQKAAQAHYRQNTSDPDNLDGDNDGIACEKELPCPCDPPDANGPVGNPDNGNGSATGGGLCHEQCRPSLIPQCKSLQESDFLFSQCANSLNHSPGFNRPVALTFLVPSATVPCGGQTILVARLVYPDGVGAPNWLFTFQASLGTVGTNLLSDFAGYVQSTYVAPLSPALVQVDAMADGLRQSLQLKVECAQPGPQIVPPQTPAPIPPIFSPPKTGEAGLVSSDAR